MLKQMPIDRFFQALAEPTRRAIFERLSLGSASVSALAEPFDLTLAAVVQHVQSLEQSGLIRTEKVGRIRTCHIDPRMLLLAQNWLADRRALWERRLDRLGNVLGDQTRATPKRKSRP